MLSVVEASQSLWIPTFAGMTYFPCYSYAEIKDGRRDKSKTPALFCARFPALVRIYADIFRGIFFDSFLWWQRNEEKTIHHKECGNITA